MKMKINLQLMLAALVVQAIDAAAIEQTYTIQSDWSSAEQNKWFGNYYVTGGQSDGTLKIGGWGDYYATMIKIPVNFNVPGRNLINGAALHLYSYGSPRPTTMQKIFWLGSWSESSTSDHWSLLANHQYGVTGDAPAPPVNGWYTMDISQEYALWLFGSYPNNGMALFPYNHDNRFNNFYSPKGPGGGLSLRPFITVRYETIPDFKMPLPGGVGWKLTTEAGGKTYDDQFNQNPDPAHMGQTYYSLDFSPYWIPLTGGSQTLDTDVPIYAAAGGVVVAATNSSANGNYVKIDHDYDGNTNTGFQTVYLHFKNPAVVNVGSIVRQGQLLGTMGTTGISTGVHIHITFYFQNRAGPNGSDSYQLNFATMEGVLLKDYKLNTHWNTSLSPNQFDPAFYASSNTPH